MSPGPYHLLSLGSLLLLSYIVSLLMLHSRVIPQKNHRKFWNTLLLLFFMSTAILGILLVIKVNYKLKISWVEEAIQWHVDSGIGFTLVAIFHLLWHTRYYLVVIKPGSIDKPRMAGLSFNKFQQRFLFILLGYISIMAQMVMLREFLKNFHGNELVIGIFLAIWMILTALGARLGAKYPDNIGPCRISLLLLAMGMLPQVIYLLLILISRFLFLPGLQPGLLDTLVIIVLLTSPFTILSGFLFGNVSRTEENANKEASPYMLDALGSVAGGLLFAILLVHFLDNFQILTLLFVSTSIGVILVFRIPSAHLSRWILSLSATLLFILSLLPGLQKELEELRYRQEEILETRDTPFGNLTFTLANEQVSAYMDGNPVLTSNNLMNTEESVHFPALQHPNPTSFLFLGGGMSGQIAEAVKYKPQRIDYCETNPWIYYLGKEHFNTNSDFPYRFIPMDGRTWLMKSQDELYDVIISNAGDPLTIGWNRYFTQEFYTLVKQHLSTGGIFCMQLTTADSYVNEEGLRILGINDQTLKQVFSHVLIVPGSSCFFLASERPLSLDFPGLLSQRQIPTTYVHPDYLDANHIKFDSDQLTGRVQEHESGVNSDLRPRLFFASLLGNESRSGKHSLRVAGIISALLFLFLLIRYSPVKRAMYVTGFTGAGIQIILIMVIQSYYGFAYGIAPLMISLFMSGIITGTILWKRMGQRSSMPGIRRLVMLMALLALSGLILPLIGGLFESRWSGQLLIGVLNFFPGMLVGWVYAVGSGVKKEGHSGIFGELYSADLTGAALGTLIPAIFLLPLIGASNTFILFFGINLVTGLSLMLRGVKTRNDG